MFEVFSCLVRLSVLEDKVSLSETSGRKTCNRCILDSVIRSVPVTAVEVMLAEIDLSAAPDVMVGRTACEVADMSSIKTENFLQHRR